MQDEETKVTAVDTEPTEQSTNGIEEVKPEETVIPENEQVI